MINISGKEVLISQEANACFPANLAFGQTVNAELGQAQDCYSTLGPGVRYADRYMFLGAAGQQVAITMNSTELSSYLRLSGPLGPTYSLIAFGDALPTSPNSQIPQTGRYFTLPAAGLYIIEATVAPLATPRTGKYSLSLGTSCVYTFDRETYPVRGVGGSSSFTITATNTCAWTATSDASWITITGGAQGTGNGAVSFKVALNIFPVGRTGTITVSGKKFTVQQAGAL